MTNFQMVKDFHQAFGINAPLFPSNLSHDRQELRQDLIEEEYSELQGAMYADDPIGIADGLADLLYVVYGTAVEYGIDIDEVFKEVHRSNMSKLEVCSLCNGRKTIAVHAGRFMRSPIKNKQCPDCEGKGSKPIFREDGKVLKGPNFSLPDIKKCLDRQFLRD